MWSVEQNRRRKARRFEWVQYRLIAFQRADKTVELGSFNSQGYSIRRRNCHRRATISDTPELAMSKRSQARVLIKDFELELRGTFSPGPIGGSKKKNRLGGLSNFEIRLMIRRLGERQPCACFDSPRSRGPRSRAASSPRSRAREFRRQHSSRSALRARKYPSRLQPKFR
jgi:hypothetical protein